MTRTPRLPLVALLALAVAACGGNQPATPSAPAGATQPPPSAPATSGAATPLPVPTGAALGDRLLASITVPAAPCAMAIDASSAWVTSNSTGQVARVDAATNAVVGSVAIAGNPCGIAVGPDGRIWVAVLGTGAVVAVDPVSLEITARQRDVGSQLWDLKAGFGSIWVADRTARAVLRIDPEDASIIATIPVGPQPSGLAVMPAGVWVSDDTDGMLRKIDPATNEVATTVSVGAAPSWFADDGSGHLVIAQRGRGEVLSVDQATGTFGEPSGGWIAPLDGTVIDGVAWIPDGRGRRVGVIELGAATPEVTHYALPGAINPFVAEPAFGEVWVLDFGATTIWRIRP